MNKEKFNTNFKGHDSYTADQFVSTDKCSSEQVAKIVAEQNRCGKERLDWVKMKAMSSKKGDTALKAQVIISYW